MDIYIHLGVHKTGSSFMQRLFFNSLVGIQYCDCRTDYLDFLDYLLHADDFGFSPRKAAELFAVGGNLSSEKPVVLSDEMFYAPMQWSRYAHRKRGCERLAKMFPGSHVSIVLRNQPSLIRSFYRMYIKTGGTATWNEFLRSHLAEGYFHFEPYVTNLMEQFGPGQISVFLYEDFVATPDSYLDNWCDWLGIPQESWDRKIVSLRENPSISPKFLSFLRFINKFVSSRRHPDLLFPRQLHGLATLLLLKFSALSGNRGGKNLCPETEALEMIINGCRAGNRKLSGVLDRDLNALGYPC